MKKLAFAFLTAVSLFTSAATLNPVQLLNPAGSTAGQSIVSTGPSTAPGFALVGLTNGVSGILPVANGGLGVGTITGLALGNGTSPLTGYAGTSCANQFPRSLNASGAATCASIANADLAGSITASKLVGTDIATVGTITAGTWNGTTLAVANGGTNATTASAARTSLSAAQSGSNTDITSLSAPALGAATATTASAGNSSTLVATTAFLTTPGPIGSSTASTGAFTTLSANSTVSGIGFSTYLASPPAIGATAASTGKFTTLQATGSITPSTTNGIVGTTLADSAIAGSVGEVITATGTGVSISAGTQTNITSVALTAGDWDVSGANTFISAGSTSSGTWATGLSTTSAVLPAVPDAAQLVTAVIVGSTQGLTAPTIRINVSSPTTVYLVGYATFSVSTMTCTGKIIARRRR